MTTDRPQSIFAHWIDLLCCAKEMLYCKEQTASSCNALAQLAESFSPTVVLEFGVEYGISTHVWLHTLPDTRIFCIDRSFEKIAEVDSLLPLDYSRTTLLETKIDSLDYTNLWSDQDAVLVFVHTHSKETLRHVVDCVIPLLPSKSLLVVDTIWYSAEVLDDESAPLFCKNTVFKEITPFIIADIYFGAYHGGGSFLGFETIEPLLAFVNSRGIVLECDVLGRFAHCTPTRKKASLNFSAKIGHFHYNPFLPIVPSAEEVLYRKNIEPVANLFEKVGAKHAEVVLQDKLARGQIFPGIAYATALCHVYQNDLSGACGILDVKDADLVPEQASVLHRDLVSFLAPLAPPKKQRRPGVTLFAIPKAFVGHTGCIQRNAIESWTRMTPRPDIILFGNESGTKEIAERLGLLHVPDIACNEFGTPLLDCMFWQAQQKSETEMLAYVNADILLFDDFMQAAATCKKNLSKFLMVGQRCDYTVLGDIDFTDPHWAETMRSDAKINGMPLGCVGIDYFVFVPGLWLKIPPFGIGRTLFDNWLLEEAHALARPVVDATDFVLALHQTHGYGHAKGGLDGIGKGLEAKRNQLLAKKITMYGNLCGATYSITQEGLLESRKPKLVEFPNWFHHRVSRINWLLRQARDMLVRWPENVDDILEETTRTFQTLVTTIRPEEKNEEAAKEALFRAQFIHGCTVQIAEECLHTIGVNIWDTQDHTLRSADACIASAVFERVRLQKNPIVFDIGANTGLVAFLPLLQSDMTVYAFEPNPGVASILQKNIFLNHIQDRVFCHTLALSNHDGSETLAVSEGHTGFSCLGKPKRFVCDYTIDVPTMQLDTFLAQNTIPKLDCIKIDTEGCELRILQGASKTLEQFLPDIILECNEINLEQCNTTVGQLRAFLENLGYTFTMISNEDALCIHKSKR